MSEIQPLRLSMEDLTNLVSICENEIRLVDFSNTVFGVDGAMQMRAIASNIQARLQNEIFRQGQLSEARRVEEERKKAEATKDVKAPEPVKA